MEGAGRLLGQISGTYTPPRIPPKTRWITRDAAAGFHDPVRLPNGPDPSAGTSVTSAGISQPGPPRPPGGRQLPGRWRLTAAAAITAVAVLIAYLVVSTQHHGTTPAASGAPGSAAGQPDALHNPGVDPGTVIPGRPAPGFTLTDQFG